MIITTKGATQEQLDDLIAQMLELGFNDVKQVSGTAFDDPSERLITLHGMGDVPSDIEATPFLALGYVIDAQRISSSQPYKLISREHHPDLGKNGQTLQVKVGNVIFGGSSPVYIAGPCAVYNEDQMMATAFAAKDAGAHMLRGGAFKPRTSPHSFQGLGEDGVKLLVRARDATGLPVVTEARSERELEVLLKYEIDMVQIGTRNAQNYEFLREVAKATDKNGNPIPVLLKRGLAEDVKTWLGSAEYFPFHDNWNVVLCERGVAPTSYTVGRNISDFQAIIEVHVNAILPVIYDPSHSTGKMMFVEPASLSAVAHGAQGLIIDIRMDSDKVAIHYMQDGRERVASYCDYDQAVVPSALKRIIERADRLVLEDAVVH